MVRALCMLVIVSCGASAAGDRGAWAVAGASYRIEVRGENPPGIPEAGWEIRLPDFGAGRPDARDMVLLGPDGKEIALDTVWCGQGRATLVLAESMPDGGAPAVLYFGGKSSRRMKSWSPRRSLLLETRRLPAGSDLTSYSGLQAAWTRARETDGAAFVPLIFHGDNPFGESSNFLSRYTGVLKPGKPGDVGFYSLSDDVSYVVVNGRTVLEWNKNQPAPLDPRKVPTAKVRLGEGPITVSYSHGVANPPAAMALGWDRGGKPGTVPSEAWVHPGSVKAGRAESEDGSPVPLAMIETERYIGYAGAWFVRLKCSLPELAGGWQAEWIWPDGCKLAGQVTNRLWMSLDPVRVIVRIRKDNRVVEGRRTFLIPQSMEAASVNQHGQLQPFLDLLAAENPEILSENDRKSGFLLARDFLPIRESAKWAQAWLKTAKPAEPAWVAAMTTVIRDAAGSDPKAALAMLEGMDAPARAAMGAAGGLLELDLRVFDLKDPGSAGMAARLAKNPDKSVARMATIRLGDHHLIHGRINDAMLCYTSVQDKNPEFSGRAPVIDRSHSLAIDALVEGRNSDEARSKLQSWETAHSAAKVEGDLLYWRARVAILSGDWKRALLDLETSLKVRPGAPGEIDTLFWQGRVLFELDRKDEARKVWNAILKDYPKHERAEEAKSWLQKN